MLIKVIYSDGSTGVLRNSRLAKLLKLNRIASYRSPDGWVAVEKQAVKPQLPWSRKRKYGLNA